MSPPTLAAPLALFSMVTVPVDETGRTLRRYKRIALEDAAAYLGEPLFNVCAFAAQRKLLRLDEEILWTLEGEALRLRVVAPTSSSGESASNATTRHTG